MSAMLAQVSEQALKDLLSPAAWAGVQPSSRLARLCAGRRSICCWRGTAWSATMPLVQAEGKGTLREVERACARAQSAWHCTLQQGLPEQPSNSKNKEPVSNAVLFQ